jgi:hypothetical protein
MPKLIPFAASDAAGAADAVEGKDKRPARVTAAAAVLALFRKRRREIGFFDMSFSLHHQSLHCHIFAITSLANRSICGYKSDSKRERRIQPGEKANSR